MSLKIARHESLANDARCLSRWFRCTLKESILQVKQPSHLVLHRRYFLVVYDPLGGANGGDETASADLSTPEIQGSTRRDIPLVPCHGFAGIGTVDIP